MNNTITVLGLVFGALLLLFLGFEIWWILRYRRNYLFSAGEHEVVVRISPQSVALFVDGLIQDEFAARGMHIVTLRATVDGEEFAARALSVSASPSFAAFRA